VETTVLIIGGGVTGAGLARDLALRGIDCVLVEKDDVNAGASGGNHGLLHSGARYVGVDAVAARECRDEGALLKRLASHCIEETGGLFVALKGDDERYVADFPGLCARSGIDVCAMETREALELEPELSERIVAAYAVPDGSIDPFKLSLDNVADAVRLGARFMSKTEVISFQKRANAIETTTVRSTTTGVETRIRAQVVVSAAGAWSGHIAAMAGAQIELVYSKGTLLVTHDRVAQRVINRLRPATDADIVVPGGTVSILGTTSVRISDPDDFQPTIGEIDLIIDEAGAMIPVLNRTRYIRAFSGVRPLFGPSSGGGDRTISRSFALLDHEFEGVTNLVTITGGKLTTFRLMAEKAADLVLSKMGVDTPCLTRTFPLPPCSSGRWTEPGLAPRDWVRRGDPKDEILCECEMVPRSVVDEILETMPGAHHGTLLQAIGLRTRIGKGPCQGGLCSIRMAAYLYDKGRLGKDSGLEEIRGFLAERWRGVHPLLWGFSAIQSEFQEALHCGLLGLEIAGVERK
jgi:glycerol-3-phosphate dehydrogenase